MKTPCEPGYCSDQSAEYARSWNRQRQGFLIAIGGLALAIVVTVLAALMGL